jgi:hypothetical protein
MSRTLHHPNLDQADFALTDPSLRIWNNDRFRIIYVEEVEFFFWVACDYPTVF